MTIFKKLLNIWKIAHRPGIELIEAYFKSETYMTWSDKKTAQKRRVSFGLNHINAILNACFNKRAPYEVFVSQIMAY